MKRSDIWLTPDNVFNELCEYWEFEPNLDAAASKENTKCKYFINKEQDAHKTNWLRHHCKLTCNDPDTAITKVWINPPTSQIHEYSKGAVLHFKTYRTEIEILMIMPANSFCNPYQEKLLLPLLESGDLKIKPIFGKIKFLKGEPDPEQSRLAKFKPYKAGVAAQNWISLMFRKL